MLKSITDRNILFGIFALQMGFITRDALVTAVRTWVLNKNKSVSQILQEQDAIDGDTLTLIEALVQKHLAMHGNDAAKSLAAISSIAQGLLDELQQISDSDVRNSVAQAGTDATVDLATMNSPGAGASTSKGVRFRILRPHAKGGLGQVYVARDEELNRDVALKEIQGRHADHPESRTRFMLEAEITGGLEHPGIVPVYGLGQYGDGRPFYAMRFIRGDSLKDAISKFHKDARPWREKALELRELLERFIDVCNAMQYAHDRGVLHRDLKPGNIMLGKYGETLVVDWGLAKPLGVADPKAPGLSEEGMLRPASASGSAGTLQGAAVGTPQFMSPEQAAGHHNELGPASDIYSLGATLYSLLTGKTAFEVPIDASAKVDLDALLKKVQAGEFPAPRQLNVEISPPLEAICLKAMALKPETRYVTPRALIEDVKNWLADEPVSAWPEPWTVKTRRWMARHRTLVTGVAAALIVGVVSLSVATVLLAQANDVIQKKNKDLTDANTTIKEQNDAIKKEVNEKEKQRKLAEARLRQSLDAVGLFANDARQYTEDAMVPGESRRRLYEVLITQLERQVDQEGEATIDSLYNKLWMYQTLAAVNIDFNEDTPAKRWIDKGLQSVETWEKLRPGDSQAQSFHAALLHLRGAALEKRRKLAEAKGFYSDALKIRRGLLEKADPDPLVKGKRMTEAADSLEGLEQFDEAIQLREQVVKLHANDKDGSLAAREALSWSYMKAGLAVGDYAKRKALLTKADSMSAEVMAGRKSNRNVLLRWAMIAKMFGELEYNHGKLAEQAGKKEEAAKYYADAKVHYAKLNEISKKLATSNELIDGLRDYSRSYYTLGLVEELNGNPTMARAHYQTCKEIRELTFHDYATYPISFHLKIDLLFAQIALGELRDAMAQADNLFIVAMTEPDGAYRLACVYALAINTIAQSKEPLTDNDKRLQKRYHMEALKCLQLAHDGGFPDLFQTTIDADFSALRDDPAMKEFDAAHHYQLGVAAKKHGALKKADAEFEKSQKLAEEAMKVLKKENRYPHVKIAWLCAHVQRGHYADAIKEADELAPTLGKRSTAMFRLARVYSLASAATKDVNLREQYRGKALDALNQAADSKLRQTLLTEDDLEPIRNDPRFAETLRRYPEGN